MATAACRSLHSLAQPGPLWGALSLAEWKSWKSYNHNTLALHSSSASQSRALQNWLERHARLLQQLHCAGDADVWRQARRPLATIFDCCACLLLHCLLLHMCSSVAFLRLLPSMSAISSHHARLLKNLSHGHVDCKCGLRRPACNALLFGCARSQKTLHHVYAAPVLSSILRGVICWCCHVAILPYACLDRSPVCAIARMLWYAAQALRLDDACASELTLPQLLDIVGTCPTLKQLALLGLEKISKQNLSEAIAKLPELQVRAC